MLVSFLRLLWVAPLLAAWVLRPSGTDASLRGLSALDEQVAWASGTKGTVVKTSDGGRTWSALSVPGSEELDFRDLEAVDASTVYLMSAGPGRLSRIYKTNDVGRHWTPILDNPDARGFFDAMAFWDRDRGLVLGDPVDGKFVLLRTLNGGASWQRLAPPANPEEGAFAASGTCLVVRPGGRAWFATGGPGGGRVFRSTDYAVTWQAAQTPIRNDKPSAGVFSIAFRDDLNGIAVGGDYSTPEDDRDNIALTDDGGRTWQAVRKSQPKGFRSAVVFLEGGTRALATGPGGTDLSDDGGKNWAAFSSEGFHALSAFGWASGSQGRIAATRPTPTSEMQTGAVP